LARLLSCFCCSFGAFEAVSVIVCDAEERKERKAKFGAVLSFTHTTSNLPERAYQADKPEDTLQSLCDSPSIVIAEANTSLHLSTSRMPKGSTSKLYQRTKALLTPPSSPPSTLATSLETSPSSSSKMSKRSNPSSSTTIVEQPRAEAGIVEVPKSEWKAPKKIGTLQGWLIFYEGMFAGSMLEVVSFLSFPPALQAVY